MFLGIDFITSICSVWDQRVSVLVLSATSRAYLPPDNKLGRHYTPTDYSPRNVNALAIVSSTSFSSLSKNSLKRQTISATEDPLLYLRSVSD